MKKRILTLIFTGTIILSLCSCGSKESADNTTLPTVVFQESQSSQENNTVDENTLSFDCFKNLEFCFCSGAGGWQTTLSISADGSFSGDYFDGELGATGDDYPNGTMYQCNFNGQFSNPVKINDYTYSMQISELNFTQEVGTEEIVNGTLYCYTEAYGLDNAENILIYLPGAPLAELPEEFLSWVGYYDLSSTTDTELSFYALNNETQQYGFTSYDMIENLKSYVSYAADSADSLEKAIETDASLTQADLNQNALDLYNEWDYALNHVWKVLERTMDKDSFASLVTEEREWIALKEQKANEAGAEYEGGSMQPMVINLKAAEMTKERVYELMKLLD